MFDNVMAEAVVFSMHDEQLARAAANRRVKEAERAGKSHRRGMGHDAIRVSLAKGLVTLAARIAPTIAVSNPSTPALAA